VTVYEPVGEGVCAGGEELDVEPISICATTVISPDGEQELRQSVATVEPV
jgi:hypothetical protein